VFFPAVALFQLTVVVASVVVLKIWIDEDFGSDFQSQSGHVVYHVG
jgi:hypothetical protein